MENSAKFCTCRHTDCPLHPSNHDKGCTPCISKNQKTKGLPECYFNLVDGHENRKADGLKDFAELILNHEEKNDEQL